MDRKTFVRQLEQLLADWPDPQEREEQILYYEEMLVDLSDEQASQKIEQLGGPQGVAEELRRKKGLPARADAGWQDDQSGWEQPQRPSLEQRLAERKSKNRRRGRIVAAVIAAVVVLAAAAAGAVWLLCRPQQPGGESGSNSEAGGSSSALVSESADSGAVGASSGSDQSLQVSGQLPEEAALATRLVVETKGAELAVKSGDAWNIAGSDNAAVRSSVEDDCLQLELETGAFVLTVPAGVTDIQITGSQGRLDLRQLETDSLQLDISAADAALQDVIAVRLSVTLQMGSFQADSLVLTDALTLDLQNANAQISMKQPESYGYAVECQQGSLTLGPDSWTSEDQPQQAQQTAEGFQFDLKIQQGNSSILFAQP